MFNKIKELFTVNFYCFRKFWIFQLVISFLGVMVTLPLSTFISKNPDWGKLPYAVAALFCGGMFCFLVYDTLFRLGAKDSVHVQSKRINYEPLKGLWIALLAYIPTFLIIIVELFFVLFNYGNGFTVTHVILNVGIHAQYQGFMFLFPNDLGWVSDIVAVIFAPAFGCLGYYLGVHDKTLREIFGIKVSKKGKK